MQIKPLADLSAVVILRRRKMANSEALVGTWRMISWTKKDIATGEITDAMGPNPQRFMSYQPDGRMISLVVDSRRPALKGPTPSEDEKARLFDSMLAYSARYILTDDKLIHFVDLTCNPSWVGVMERPCKIEDGSLIISDAPGTDPLTGAKVLYRMEFKKA
jgi:hypothetical protein